MALGKGRSETRGSVFQEFVIVSVFCRLKCLLSDMFPGVACGVRVGLTVPLRVCGVDCLVWLPMQGVQVRAAALGALGTGVEQMNMTAVDVVNSPSLQERLERTLELVGAFRHDTLMMQYDELMVRQEFAGAFRVLDEIRRVEAVTASYLAVGRGSVAPAAATVLVRDELKRVSCEMMCEQDFVDADESRAKFRRLVATTGSSVATGQAPVVAYEMCPYEGLRKRMAELLSRGDYAGAARVQAEIRRLHAEIAPHVAAGQGSASVTSSGSS